MEKILEALVDEITTRVLAKLEDNTSNMFSALKIKTKAENIEGLDAFIDERIDSFDWNKTDIRDIAANAGEDAAMAAVKNASFDVEVNF